MILKRTLNFSLLYSKTAWAFIVFKDSKDNFSHRQLICVVKCNVAKRLEKTNVNGKKNKVNKS